MNDPRPADHGLVPILDLDGEPLVAPPGFDALLGYGRDRRHLALSWGVGDTIEYDDGRVSATGHGYPWLLWSRHLAVRPSLTGIDYGSCDSPPLHRVVLDRFTSRLYVGLVGDTVRFLASAADLRAEREAWEALTPEEQRAVQEAAGEQLHEIMRDVLDLDSWTEVTTDGLVAGVEAGMRMDRAAIPRLVEWLDGRDVPCPSCAAASAAGRYQQDGGIAACPSCAAPFYDQPLFDRMVELRRARQGPPQPPQS